MQKISVIHRQKHCTYFSISSCISIIWVPGIFFGSGEEAKWQNFGTAKIPDGKNFHPAKFPSNKYSVQRHIHTTKFPATKLQPVKYPDVNSTDISSSS